MKKILFITCLLITVFTAKAQNNKPNADAVKMLKSFYTAYITEIASSDDIQLTNKKTGLLIKQNCTARCIKRAHELTEKTDADPFIKAQDINKGDEKNIEVKVDDKMKDIYYVTYTDIYGKQKRTIKMQLIKQAGVYKIDYLWD